MSFPALSWAVSQKLPCTQKIVLMMLADRHNNDTGQCNPSHDRLAVDCGLSRRSVMDQIAKLEDSGFIRIRHRVSGNVKLPNQYVLVLSFGTQEEIKDFDDVVNDVPKGGEPVAYKPVIEPVKEPKERKTAQAPSFSVPDWINEKHWDAWHSCDKRKKATNAQKQMAVEKLGQWRQEGIDFAGALENAAVAGWQGLFKPDDKRPAAMTSSNRNTHKYAGAAAAIWGNDDNFTGETINA